MISPDCRAHIDLGEYVGLGVNIDELFRVKWRMCIHRIQAENEQYHVLMYNKTVRVEIDRYGIGKET